MKTIKQFIAEIFSEVIEQKMPRIVHLASINITKDLFAYIGKDRIQKILDETKGAGTYISLAELFSTVQRRNLAKEQNEIRHQLFETTPELSRLLHLVEDSTEFKNKTKER